MAITKITTPELIDLPFNNTDGIVLAKGSTTTTIDTTGTCNYPTTATALYQLNSGVGSNVPDTCTPAYNGTATSITYSAGNFGNAANFNGTSSRITSSPISGLSSTSISCWLKSSNSSSSERRGVVELNADTSSNGYAGTLSILYRYSDGSILVRNGNASSSETDLLTHTDTTLRNGNWNNLVVTRNESTGVTTLYINGSQVDQETVASTSTVGGGTIIGDRYAGSAGNYNWDGQINQLRIFPSALTAAQASSLATETNVNAVGRPTTNLSDGEFRYNTTTKKVEYYDGADWFALTSSVSVPQAGTTTTCNYPTTALALYQLNDNAVDTCNSNQYPGTWTGTESYVTGNFGKAASFSNGSGATSNYISLSSFMPTGSNSRSISMWIKTTSTSYQELFSYGSGGNNNFFIFRLPAGGTQLGIAFYANDHDFTATNITDGNWHHCAATYDGNLAKVYYDGVLIGTGTAGSVSTNASNEKISGYQYTGSIDQVRLFSSALTANQVSALYTETAP